MKKMLFITLLAAILSGCATSPPPINFWKKAEISLEQAQDVYSKCKYDIGMNKVSKEKESELINSCMQMQGFRMGKYYNR